VRWPSFQRVAPHRVYSLLAHVAYEIHIFAADGITRAKNGTSLRPKCFLRSTLGSFISLTLAEVLYLKYILD